MLDKVADTQIKGMGFNTGVEAGTKVQNSGQHLAKIVATAIGTKRSLDNEQAEVDRLDTKSSTLAFNDLKIGYQKAWNEYDFADATNPSSSELMDFHEKIRGEQSELKAMLIPEHAQAYDLFHAGKDGDIKNVISGEAKLGAKNLMATSIMGLSTVDEVNELNEALNGMAGTTTENLKVYTDQIEGYLDSNVLDGLTSKQIAEKFPLLLDIKDPTIGSKIRKHILKLEQTELATIGLNDGESLETVATKNKLTREETKKLATTEIDKYVGSDNPDDVKYGIEMANHHGIKVKTLDNLAEKIVSTIESDTAAAVAYFKQYEDTKEFYTYPDKAEESLNAFNIVGSMYGLDLTNEEDLKTAYVKIVQANAPDAPKFKTPTDKEILDYADPLFSNSKGNYGESKFSYVAPRVRELMKYTSGDMEKAMDLAEAEWDSFDNNASPDNWGWFDDTPLAMFAKDSDEVTLAKEQFSLNTDADSVDLKYAGGNQWAMTVIDDDGREQTMFRSSKQMKAAIKERQIFKDGLETLDAVASKKKLGNSLREKQITKDAKEVKTFIGNQTKALEEKLGEKLSSIQKTELEKEVVEVLKNEVRKADLKEKGGFAYDSESSTVTFSFGQVVEDIFNTVMGVELPKNEEIIDVAGEEDMKGNPEPLKENMVYTASNEEIMSSILDSELGSNEFVEGKLHAGQETITASKPNGELNTTNYGVVIDDFPKKKGESDKDHAIRYYDKKVRPALANVKGIETASKEVIMGLSKLVWNKGNIVKNLDLNDSKKTISTLLDVTTTSGKHSNGVINRSIADYAMIAGELGLPKVSYVRTTKAVGGKYRIQYLDANQNVIHDDARKAPTAKGSRIKAGKTYNVIDNNITI